MSKKNSIRIIYEDEYLLVVDKSAGLLVVPADNEKGNDLTALLNAQYSQNEKNMRIYPCHRLDKETSGLIIFAKSKRVQQAIMDEFRNREVRKHYIAFIQGKLKQRSGVLKSYIQAVWPYMKKGKKKLAITNFQTQTVGKNFSVLKLQPLTGRTNQIRIQFRDIGHPLVGERRFAFARDWPVKFRRTALHAAGLEFAHPINKSRIKLQSELPEDMSEFLNKNGISLPVKN
ncbi:MAG: RNA pseudouridine synthase [PVC group bacterium]|nr:RNA pseudouridine synthase [PVC group bacterium]